MSAIAGIGGIEAGPGPHTTTVVAGDTSMRIEDGETMSTMEEMGELIIILSLPTVGLLRALESTPENDTIAITALLQPTLN